MSVKMTTLWILIWTFVHKIHWIHLFSSLLAEEWCWIWPFRPSLYLNWLKCQLNYDWSRLGGSTFVMSQSNVLQAKSKASPTRSARSLRASSHKPVCLNHLPVKTNIRTVNLSVGLFCSLTRTVNFMFSDPFTINVCRFTLHCKTL